MKAEIADPVADLLAYIDASPTPYHAVETTRGILQGAGFRRLPEAEPWLAQPGDRVFVLRGGTLLAAIVGSEAPVERGLRILGAHTDSPNLRVRPFGVQRRQGYPCVPVEIYGGVLWHTWLDRDLSMAGRLALRGGEGGIESKLVRSPAPLLRIPSLAIHLNRSVNSEGLVLNAEEHMVPVVGLDDAVQLPAMLAEQASFDPADLRGWDLCLMDHQPSCRGGPHGELLFAPRLDNLASCHAAVRALCTTQGTPEATQIIALYDHEECGSRSAQGALSPALRSFLERLVCRAEASPPDTLARALRRSVFLSVDMAHAVHPNYPGQHESSEPPRLGQGPVIKLNANQAYATDGLGWGLVEELAQRAEVRTQRFVSRNDIPCGSTIGPLTAAELGVAVVDLGNPMWSMHSCREVAAAADVAPMIALLAACLNLSSVPE